MDAAVSAAECDDEFCAVLSSLLGDPLKSVGKNPFLVDASVQTLDRNPGLAERGSSDASCGTATWEVIRDEVASTCFKLFEQAPQSSAARVQELECRVVECANAVDRTSRLLAPKGRKVKAR